MSDVERAEALKDMWPKVIWLRNADNYSYDLFFEETKNCKIYIRKDLSPYRHKKMKPLKQNALLSRLKRVLGVCEGIGEVCKCGRPTGIKAIKNILETYNE